MSIPDADTTFQIYNSIYDDITAEEAVGTAFNELLAGAGTARARRGARLARRRADREPGDPDRIDLPPTLVIDRREATSAVPTTS